MEGHMEQEKEEEEMEEKGENGFMGIWETEKGKVMMMWLVNQLNLAKEGRTGVWRIR